MDRVVAPRILLIEDEPAVADAALYVIKAEGMASMWCRTAGEGLAQFRRQPPDLIILDVGLPDTSGFEVCKQVRAGSRVPIIFLTARAAELDRVLGLELGGDDYLVKPFSPRELTARIRAILRRSQPPPGGPPPAPASGVFSVDDAGRRILFRDRAVDLTRYEYLLFRVLLASPGRVYSRDELMSRAWDQPDASLDRTVDAHVKTLRAKLRAAGADPGVIHTHRGFGYSYEASPTAP